MDGAPYFARAVTYGVKHLVHKLTLTCLEPHFMSKCDDFSSIWWSIMIKLYLNFMFPSIFWWKTNILSKFYGLKVNLAESVWMTRGKIWTKVLVHLPANFTFQPNFWSKFDVFSSIWCSVMIDCTQTSNFDEKPSGFVIKWHSSTQEWMYRPNSSPNNLCA